MHIGLQRFLPHDFARQPQALDRHLAVVGIGPVVRDRSAARRPGRRCPAAPCRASAGAGTRSSASRPDCSASRRRPRCRSRGRDGTGCRASAAVGSAYQKPPVSKRLDATGPFLNSRYCRPAHGRAVQLGVVVVGVVAGAFGDDEQVEMVLQVGADAGQVVHRRDADRLQMVGRADAGQHAAASASRWRRSRR